MVFALPIIPFLGALLISIINLNNEINLKLDKKKIKFTALLVSLIPLIISILLYIEYNNSSNKFQEVEEYFNLGYINFNFGYDGISLVFILLTTIITFISLISNLSSIKTSYTTLIIIILVLESLLLTVFLVLDSLLYYIYFESILIPLFILIGLFGSKNKIKASFYLFLYTLLGSLFLLLSILAMSSKIGTFDYNILYKNTLDDNIQLYLFYGIFIAFAVKTPTIFLNIWLLRAHVESPLSGSIILAGIVLKLSLYGIFRLILPILFKAYIKSTFIISAIGVISIIYASFSTLRALDIKELIANSSVSHAAVYLLGAFSNNLQGLEGSILLGLAHGFVSPGLFICVGGVLYDRTSTRLITYYRGLAQIMPIFSILFFILCLGNCGVPLTLNFLGEFMCLYGIFERLVITGSFASVSIILSAAYSIYLCNRIIFGGSYSRYFLYNIPDLKKREFNIILILTLFTIIGGVYPIFILDSLHFSCSSVIYSNINY